MRVLARMWLVVLSVAGVPAFSHAADVVRYEGFDARTWLTKTEGCTTTDVFVIAGFSYSAPAGSVPVTMVRSPDFVHLEYVQWDSCTNELLFAGGLERQTSSTEFVLVPQTSASLVGTFSVSDGQTERSLAITLQWWPTGGKPVRYHGVPQQPSAGLFETSNQLYDPAVATGTIIASDGVTLGSDSVLGAEFADYKAVTLDR